MSPLCRKVMLEHRAKQREEAAKPTGGDFAVGAFLFIVAVWLGLDALNAAIGGGK